MPDAARRRVPSALVVASVAVPMVVAAVVAGLRSATRPLWRDEYATALHASLDFGSLVRAVSHVDGVFGPYYALMHPLHWLGDADEAWYRLPSIAAFIVAAGGVALLALRWWGPVAAVVGGVVFALNPVVLAQATNARPYAISVALFVAALVALDVALRQTPRRWPAWVGYALLAALAALLHPFAAVAVATSAVLVAGRPGRTVVAWLAASAPAGIVALAMLVATSGQSGQLTWLRPADLRETIALLADVAGVSPGYAVAFDLAALGVVAAMAVTTLLAFGRAPGAGPDRVRTVLFAGALLALPAVVLFAGTWLVSPMLTDRYLIWSTVGCALLVGAAAGAAVERAGVRSLVAGALALVVVAGMVALTVQRGLARQPGPSDLAQAVDLIEASARPGDRIVIAQRYWEGGVAYEFARAAGDDAYGEALRALVPDGPQPFADLRVVTGVDPLTTEPADTLDGEDLWLVALTPVTDDDRDALGRSSPTASHASTWTMPRGSASSTSGTRTAAARADPRTMRIARDRPEGRCAGIDSAA
ncbi:hypothetical protein [Agromyces mangrovi Wang et al. 2018]|uniref:hypothetical protein n=1 Tax=Agromyces mangrovi TaxID=1858653 RepID=UPI0025728294|nr:hypothetical protein [Agromyces mangrovi]BDZ63954.1 hypothetical protein GCM10025877_08920 [Agromyces mangrovi]